MKDDQTLALVLVLLAIAAIAIWAGSTGLRLLARAIAYAEGYGVPGAIPTVRNNPGDLKLPADGGAITTFATAAEGWAALYRQLTIIVTGQSRFYTLSMTLGQMARVWTATEQSAWLSNVLTYLRRAGWNVSEQTTLRELLT